MSRKILFVDDDPILRNAIGKSLAAYKDTYTVIMASDGFEAVKKMEEVAFSLVIVDLVMPRMNGMSLIQHIRGKFPDIPAIIISGTVVAELANIIKTPGVIDYFRKPFLVDDLHSAIMKTLQKEADGGIMNDVSPAVFLQLMEMDAKTCTVRIINKVSGDGGVLYFVDGQLLDARIGVLHGIEAAYKVFSWDVVTIIIGNECRPRKDKIRSELQPIIMKAVGLKDESEDIPLDPVTGEVESDNISPAPALNTGVNDGSAQRTVQSNIDDLKELLQEKLGENSGVKDIYHDGSMDDVLLLLAEVGDFARFGHLKAGCIENGTETNRIILPGEHVACIDLNPDCAKNKILQLLFQDNSSLRDATNGK